MAKKPKVLLVGGMGFNVPSELKAAVDIVKHIEQGTRKLASLPAVEFILVISEFASHNIVEVVKNEAQAPIVYLRKGWASMKEELVKRCILPPDPALGGEATADVDPEAGTTCGLSEDEIWKKYKQKFIEAVKDTLRPRELVAESDLLGVLSMVGVPEADCLLILPRLQLGAVIDCPKEGYWRSLMGGDGFDFGDADPMVGAIPVAHTKKPRARNAFNAEKIQEANEKAARLKGLPFGPYPTKRAIARKMLDYEEWNPGGTQPASVNTRDRLIERAIALRIIDDTQKNLFVDHDPTMGLKSVVPQGPEEEDLPPPLPAPPVLLPSSLPAYPGEQELVQARQDARRSEILRCWPEVVAEVKKTKRMIGTILESCSFTWVGDKQIVALLVPVEFSIYKAQLDATENWGLVTKTAKEILGSEVAVRYMMDNVISR